MKSSLATLLLWCIAVPVIAVTQGRLGSESSGSFTISLRVHPKVNLENPVTELTSEPTALCISGNGVNQFSMSVMPDRGTDDMPSTIPVLLTASGEEVPLNDSVLSDNNDCDQQSLVMPKTENTEDHLTLLIAPE